MKKIKILYVVSNLKKSNGISTVIMNYFKNIDKSVFEIDFLVLGKLDNSKDTYTNEIVKLKGTIYYTNTSYKNMIKTYLFLKSFFSNHVYDIVENHATPLSYLVLNKKYFNNEIRIIHTHSSIKSSKFLNNFINGVLNFNIKKYANYFFGCSYNSGKYWFGKKTINSNNFFVIPNGTDVNKYNYNINKRKELRSEFNIKDKVVIGFVGRISKDKNLPFIINVMKKLPDDIVLFLIGSSNKSGNKIINSISNSNNIKYLGFRNDINDLYNMFDCLILCSKREGLPMVAVESQLNYLPCIISNTITDEVNIGLCKFLPLKTDEWTKELQKIKNDDNRFFDIDIKKFDITENVKYLEKVYKNIIKIREKYLE